MRRITPLDRVLLLLAVLLAAYQVVMGVEGLSSPTVACLTVGFGTLLVAELIIIILGYECLQSPHLAVVSTLIPLSLAAGLVAMLYPSRWQVALGISLASFIAVLLTRYGAAKNLALPALVMVHAASGLLIFILPLVTSLQGVMQPGFAWVGLGGGLVGLYGLLFSFLRAGKPIVHQDAMLAVLPVILLLATAAFVVGFASI